MALSFSGPVKIMPIHDLTRRYVSNLITVMAEARKFCLEYIRLCYKNGLVLALGFLSNLFYQFN